MYRELDLKAVYSSGEDDLIKDFFVPTLSGAKEYCRSVGYFSAPVIFYVCEGLTGLIGNNGKMRLIVGTQITEEDERAILEGYQAREIIQDKLNDEIDSWNKEIPKEHYFWKRLSSLSWLIENNYLDIKVAVKRQGIYHEKVGILTDLNGDKIVFQGSVNETVAALHPSYNFESLDVYKSWNPAFEEHIFIHTKKFENLWNGKSKNTNLLIVDFPLASKEKLLKNSNRKLFSSASMEVDTWNKLVEKSRSEEKESLESLEKSLPRVPEKIGGVDFKIRAHQTQALIDWRESGYRGILELCTGSGKTITSIYGAVKIFQQSRKKRLFLVVAVPYVNLADQWCEELAKFNISPIRCYDSLQIWMNKLDVAVRRFNSLALDFACVVVVNKTLQSIIFREFISRVQDSESFLWIGDECHNHDGVSIFQCLPENTSLRMGLSATIENTKRIQDYYGSSVSRYSLEDAIRDEFLTPYEYYPHIIKLEEDEVEAYVNLTKKIIPLESARQKGSSYDERALSVLYGKRSDLIGNANQKLVYLHSLINSFKEPISNSLFYCSSTHGAVDWSEDVEVTIQDLRQIDAVTSILNENGWKVSRYTSREGRKERFSILENFKSNRTHSLVAIRCLDEGVDIPAVDTAFILASTTNSKQFIQRRGRVLRRAEGKNKAVIHDFVVLLPNTSMDLANYHKSLLKKELDRVLSFSKSSLNPEKTEDVFASICEEAGLVFDFYEA